MATQHSFRWQFGLSLILLVSASRASADGVSYGVSYKVKTIGKTQDVEKRYPNLFSHWTRLTVLGAKVSISNGLMSDIEMSCKDFLASTTEQSAGIELERGSDPPLYIDIKEKGVSNDSALKQIKDVCGSQEVWEAAQLQRQREDDAKARAERERQGEEASRRRESEATQREKEAAKREVDFRDGILVALHAAEEADPFASIRGAFDLRGSDNHQWKTSLQLPNAEKCALLKTPAATPTAASAWTFACMFRASGDGYERMVKSIQSVLNLPYEPDERPVNFNQVFFADPSKPASRFFVAKMKDGTVGISVVGVRFAGVPATAANTTPFPAVPTMLPTDPAVGGEVIRSGQASPTVSSDAQCEEYQKRERERVSYDQEIRRLASELQDLQTRYQAALRKALDSEQQANNNTVTTQNRTLATLQAAASGLANLAAQQSRAEAEGLQTQINLKQSQLTMAQTSGSSLVPTALPSGCGTNRASQATDASTRKEVENGAHSSLPPALRVQALTRLDRHQESIDLAKAQDIDVSSISTISVRSAQQTMQSKHGSMNACPANLALGRYADAVEACSEAIRINIRSDSLLPADIDHSILSREYVERAVASSAVGNVVGSQSDFQTALDLCRKDDCSALPESDIYLSRALSSFLLGDLSPAGNDCRVFLQFGQTDPEGMCAYILSSTTAQASNGSPIGIGSSAPGNRTSPTTAASIREEVEKIRSGRYAPMPPAQRSTVNAPTVSGQTTITVKNSTGYELSVFFDGPVSTKLTLTPGASRDLDLAPGTFHVAGRVAAADVLPFYGDETYAGSARYSVIFNIAP